MTEDQESQEEFATEQPVMLSPGDVYVLDPSYLDRDSGCTGPIALRVTEDQELEYLDGESRIWLNAAAQRGPQRG